MERSSLSNFAEKIKRLPPTTFLLFALPPSTQAEVDEVLNTLRRGLVVHGT